MGEVNNFIDGLKQELTDFATDYNRKAIIWGQGFNNISDIVNSIIDHLVAQGHLSPKQDEWQPIDETHIGQWFLVEVPRGNREPIVVRGFIDSVIDGEFLCLSDVGECYPTHCMPLPTPTKDRR